MKTSINISNPIIPDYCFKVILVGLFIALIVFSMQWYGAWLDLQEAKQHISFE